jgi:hypothetical protein
MLAGNRLAKAAQEQLSLALADRRVAVSAVKSESLLLSTR